MSWKKTQQYNAIIDYHCEQVFFFLFIFIFPLPPANQLICALLKLNKTSATAFQQRAPEQMVETAERNRKRRRREQADERKGNSVATQVVSSFALVYGGGKREWRTIYRCCHANFQAGTGLNRRKWL